MFFFQTVINRNVETWGASGMPPAAARVAGALSLLFWIAVITCGRWVGFSLQPGMG